MPTYYGVKFPDVPKKNKKRTTTLTQMPDRVVPAVQRQTQATLQPAVTPTPTPTQMPDRVVPTTTPPPAPPSVYLPTPIRKPSTTQIPTPPHTPQQVADTRLREFERIGQAIYGSSYRSPYVAAYPEPAPQPYISGASPDTIMGQQARLYEAAGLTPPPFLARPTPSEIQNLEAQARGDVDIFGLPIPRLERPSGAGPDVRLIQNELPAPPPRPSATPGMQEAFREQDKLLGGVSKAWEFVSPVVSPILRTTGGAILGVGELLNELYRRTTLPYYVGIREDEETRLLLNKMRLVEQMRSPTTTPDSIPRYQRAIEDIDRQLAEIRLRRLNPIQALREMRATPEQVARFEREAPWYEQLAAGMIFDPFNLISFGGGRLLQAARVAKAARSLRPVAMSVDEAADALRANGMFGKGIGRFFPLRLTNTAQREALINESVNWVNMITHDLPGNPFDNLEMFIRDPDSLARATGGITSSLPAKQTVALLREVFRDPQTGNISYKVLRNIINKAKQDRLEVVADIARKLDDAGRSLLPDQPRSLPYRVRDWLYGWLSFGQLGLNPGYAVRNAATNLTISLMDGFLPFTPSGVIGDFWKRWGGMPIQAKAGITMASDVWKARKSTLDYISSLERSEGLRGLVSGLGRDKLRPMAIFSGNIERAFSEQLVYHGTLRAWKPLWETEVTLFGQRLRGLGLPEDVINYLTGEARLALSPDELRAAAARWPRVSIPPSGASSVAAPSTGIASAVASAQTPGFPFTVPSSIKATIIDVFGDDGGRKIIEAIEQAGDNAARMAVLDVIDAIIDMASATAKRAAQIDTLGQVDPQRLIGNADAIIDLWRREGDILAEAKATHDATLARVWQSTRAMSVDDADRVWDAFWTQFLRDVRVTHEKIDDLEEALMPQLGFSEEAIKRGKDRRVQIERAWETYSKRLSEMWEKSRSEASPEARDALWNEFKQWATAHWKQEHGEALQYAARRQVDLMEALTKGVARAPAGEAPIEAQAVTTAPVAGTAQVLLDDNELRRMASAAGIATATHKGRPTDRHLLNVINKDLGLVGDARIKRLSSLTQEQRVLVADILSKRAAAKQRIIPPSGAVPPSGDVPGIIWHPMSLSAVWQSFEQAARHAFTQLRAVVNAPQVQRMPLTAPMADAVDNAINDLAARMIRAKAISARVGVAWRNAALGDYSRRRNLHDWLGWLYLYPSWYMFTYPNMALRLIAKPAFLSNYARYRALLERENERYWKEEVGLSSMPPRYTGMLRVNTPWGVRFFTVERLLNPMVNLLDNDFTTRQLQELPDWMQTVRALGNIGPSVSSPLLWAMALTVAKTNPVAARQLVGYQLSFTRPVKEFTAYLRDRLPVLEDVIPPGGAVLEAPINPAVRPQVPPGEQAHPLAGGDYWSERRIAMYLEAMITSGEITEEQAADAAFRRWGPIWDRAKQAEAIGSLPTTIMSFLGSPAFRGRDVAQARLEAMDDEWYQLRQRAQNMSREEKRAAYDEFFRRWQTYDVIRLAREYDPIKRLSEYTWMVLDRLPPGYQRARILENAGISDLISKFYNNGWELNREPSAAMIRGGPLEGGDYPVASQVWSDEEIQKLAEGIEQIAKQYNIPSPAQEAEWNKAKQIHEAKRMRALAIVQGMQGQYFSLDAIRRMENAYYSLPEEERKDYLERNPVLRAYWEALDEAERALSPEELALERSVYESPESARNRMIWEESLPPGGRWQKGLTIPSYVKDLYDETKRESMSDEQIQRAIDWLHANVPKKYMNTEEWRQARAENAELKELQRAEFGDEFMDWFENEYQPMSTAEKRAYRARNPERARMIYDLYGFNDAYGKEHPIWQKYYGYEGKGGGVRRSRRGYRRYRRYRSYRRYRGYGGYGGGLPVATPVPGDVGGGIQLPLLTIDQYNQILTERWADPAFSPLARLLFGSDIFDLMQSWFALTPEEQAEFMQQNPVLYQRIVRFLAWLQGGGGQNAKRVLESIPPRAPIGIT